jgi:DNA-directed RNA polymerase specialized sigma24 family protein
MGEHIPTSIEEVRPMSTASVTHWIKQLRDGEQEAARQLCERYLKRLIGLARERLLSSRRRVADEEDAALAALDSFFRAARAGRFPHLLDRNSLWRLLADITVCKALKQLRAERAQKRGGGEERPPADSGDGEVGFSQVLDRAPTPAEAVEFAEDYENLLNQLNDPILRSVAVWSLEGYTNAEIAERLECVESTVERKLRLIRKKWSKESPA